MRLKVVKALIFCVTLETAALTALAQETGGIQGVVLDASSKPVAGAKVYAALPDRPTDHAGTIAISDARGRFSIDGVPNGTYKVCAFKETDGYPNPVYYPYEPPEPLTQVAVRAGVATEGVTIKLGPKAARILGMILDSETGKPVTNSLTVFYQSDSSQEYMGLGGRKTGSFSVLAPFKPFRLKVTAAGYATWYYPGVSAESSAEVIQLPSGATKEITIRLNPIRPR